MIYPTLSEAFVLVYRFETHPAHRCAFPRPDSMVIQTGDVSDGDLPVFALSRKQDNPHVRRHMPCNVSWQLTHLK
jgi:hypothetical protein